MNENQNSKRNKECEVFPENTIILLDGTKLQCYPKNVQQDNHESNELQLDTTGVYFRTKQPANSQCATDNAENEILKQFFLLNAFDFLNNAKRILSDSRMFLAPVPVVSGLAHTGTNGFRRPTLGVYIEWWLNNSYTLHKDENGNESLFYQLSGSPLSGSNCCGSVTSEGYSIPVKVNCFKELWSSFMEINTRYDEAKFLYESYTLYEVVEKLWPDNKQKTRTMAELMVEKTKNARLSLEFDKLKSEKEAIIKNYHTNYSRLYITTHLDQLKVLRKKYCAKKEETKAIIGKIKEKVSELSKQKENGTLCLDEYKQQKGELTQERKTAEAELLKLENEILETTLITNDIEKDIVKEYLHR